MKTPVALLLGISFWPAIYWSPPALRFNVVQAAERSASDDQKMILQTHDFMSQTFLRSTQDFLDGLNTQLKANYPLSNPEVKKHVDIYLQGALAGLKNARVHVVEYSGVLVRTPASSDKRSDVNEARDAIDKAINRAQLLQEGFENQALTSDVKRLRGDLDNLRANVDDALGKVKALRFGKII
ncbi:MAG: hypothetical protein HY075_02695 [Deltaproteobacteria bacterium]|nr:hypothetical protein [Deltaproteobacteria bacterium]